MYVWAVLVCCNEGHFLKHSRTYSSPKMSCCIFLLSPKFIWPFFSGLGDFVDNNNEYFIGRNRLPDSGMAPLVQCHPRMQISFFVHLTKSSRSEEHPAFFHLWAWPCPLGNLMVGGQSCIIHLNNWEPQNTKWLSVLPPNSIWGLSCVRVHLGVRSQHVSEGGWVLMVRGDVKNNKMRVCRVQDGGHVASVQPALRSCLTACPSCLW